MIMFSNGCYRILPHEIEQIRKAQEIEDHLQRGCIIYYEDLEEITDREWHDIIRNYDVEEVPGIGYRMAE